MSEVVTNTRKVWATLSAVPDPFEPGILYVTQRLAGHELTLETEDQTNTAWVAIGTMHTHQTTLPSYSETRVQRCRLHANGRLENTDVAPKEIPSAHVVSIDAPTITELGKLVARELDFRDAQEVAEKAKRRSEVLDRLSAERASKGPVLSDDGKTLNWKGVNYVLQQDGGETVTESLPFYSEAPKDTVAKEKSWLSDEIPMPPVQALGVLRTWAAERDVTVAVLGDNDQVIRGRIDYLLDQQGGPQAVGAQTLVWSGTSRPIKLTLTGRHNLTLVFFAADFPDTMRGHQADHFVVEKSVLDREYSDRDDRPVTDGSGLTALENLRLIVRLGDNPSGFVLDRF